MEARIKAYAKLNFTLGITGKEGGYHLLDSLVCTVDMFDLIKLKCRKDSLITLEMHGQGTESLPYENNNAVKAAEAYMRTFGSLGADIRIFKNIPVGAGLGGSSADISGVIRGMSRIYGLGNEAELKSLADSLGSDTGYLLTGGWARLTGRGEKVENLGISRGVNVLLLVPDGGVSTAECYRLYDTCPVRNITSESALSCLKTGDIAGFGANMNNALFPSATRLCGAVKDAYEQLSSFSPLGVNMTGSGSGVFALFENAEMCAWAKSRYRGNMRCYQLKTFIPKIKGE